MSVQIQCMFDAVRSGDLRAFCVLRSLYNIDINDTSCYEEYYSGFLHVAVTQSNFKMVKKLLRLGANCNIKDYYGISPLYIGIENKVPIDIIKLLLRHGANIYDIPNGLTVKTNPILIAKSLSNQDYYKAFIPYTNGHKKWKKLKILVKVIRVLSREYRYAVNRVWSPCGSGYLEAKDHFYRLLLK